MVNENMKYCHCVGMICASVLVGRYWVECHSTVDSFFVCVCACIGAAAR